MGIGIVHVRSWQAAYQGRFPQEYLDGLDSVQRGEAWRRHFERGTRDGEVVLVADLDASVVGFASVGPSRDEDGDHGEVRAIYLLPERWGQGTGRNLMVAALASLDGFGYTQATLWVLDSNERARRFYEAGGWRHDGATKHDDSVGFPIAEVRYRRQLP